MPGILILVAEDEPSIAEVVELYLRRAGFRVQLARDGEAALDAFDKNSPDLVILDLMLPKMDGMEIMRQIRNNSDAPVIMLTARRTEMDRIIGLEMGADDYVVKPFSPQELVSRVRAVLRRSKGYSHEETESILEYRHLKIDPNTRLVIVERREILLTVKEFDLLFLMARHPRNVFTRHQLLEQVWGLSDYIDPGTVTVHIRRIREKIEKDPSQPQWIQTVWGMGYKFVP